MPCEYVICNYTMEPPRKKTLYENIHALRKKPETSKVVLLYSCENDVYIMQEAEKGTPIDDIAKTQKRTPRAIQLRIIHIALKIMRRDNLSLEQISRKYNIKLTVLSRHYQRLCEKNRATIDFMRNACVPVTATNDIREL